MELTEALGRVMQSAGTNDRSLVVDGSGELEGFADLCVLADKEPAEDAQAVADGLEMAAAATHGDGSAVLSVVLNDAGGAMGMTTRSLMEVLAVHRWRPVRIIRYADDGRTLVLARKV